MTGKKVAAITVPALLITTIIGWGAAFVFADDLINVAPVRGEAVARKRPVIKVRWLKIPLARITRARLVIDGKTIELAPPRRGTSFAYRPTGPLAEGRHTVTARVTYKLGFTRAAKAAWSFDVDTVAPPLGTASGEGYYVSPEANGQVVLKSERGAQIEARLNGRLAIDQTADAKGEFRVKLDRLDEKNTLRLAAADRAGNTRTWVLPVIKDETTPVIDWVSPGEGTTVWEVAPRIEVAFNDADSGMKRAKLAVDGTLTVEKDDDGTDKVVVVERLPDGTHQVEVEAEDYAGRKVKKTWQFTSDSRRIVVNRGHKRLYFYKDGSLQQSYGVAVGMSGYSTPGGSWQVVNKQVMPSWINPGSPWAKDMPKVIPPGLGNPLGVRAMALNARNILIHGTSDYGSIGRAASHGCIRMRNSDIINFFSIIGVGTPVDII